MGSDRARVSYDPKQQYRSVVMQQGRVTLEADWNEQQMLTSEETRSEALDIVGPSGTPDDGYLITPDTTDTDFQIKSGTMYVGGERVFLPDKEPAFKYSTQPDWLNPPEPNPDTIEREFILLHLLEQEISAVEDRDLKDVALGGPDTAQRLRIMQHIRREPVADATCDSALKQDAARWHGLGLDFDPKTMRLNPQSSLAVSFQPANGGGLCDPTTQGGYIGADNQLIRVQIASPTQILWGFDDASFLYRVDVGQDLKTLTLQSSPVDAFHQPRKSQAVEVLRATTRLSNGEYVAYAADLDNPPTPPSSFPTTLAAAYNPNDQTVVLADPLPNIYVDQQQTPMVFLRVWEQLLTFTPDTALPLGNTGVLVTLHLSAGGVFHIGDFWTFALRPDFPQLVYPERYAAAQPPEGPRQWICPLAVIDWIAEPPSAADCRNHFTPLIEPVTVQEEGTTVAVTNTLNFIGAGVSVAFDAINKRANITIPGVGGGCCPERSPTRLLFPFVTHQVGFDTGIAISNTTAEPFGPPHPPPGKGVCTIFYFPPTGLTGPPSFTLLPGEQATFTVSNGGAAPRGQKIPSGPEGFQGYVIVDCDFPGAYGFAEIMDLKGQRTGSGYLPIVLCERQSCKTGFPASFVPLRKALIAGPDSLGDFVAVGPSTTKNFRSMLQLALPDSVNQVYCDPVQLAPGLNTRAYVPSAAERNGDFSKFLKPIPDPRDPTGKSFFSGNIIPTSPPGAVLAWRFRSKA